jgi:membrane fusion protein (multidrug efflux system)
MTLPTTLRPHTVSVASVIILAGLSVQACTSSSASPSEDRATRLTQQVEGARVEVTTLQQSDAAMTLTFPGEVEGARDARLAAQLGGYVESVHVQDGDRVRRGQLLARIDASVQRAQLEQAQAQAELAQAELERARALGDMASAAQLQAVETQARVAAAQQRLAETRLARAELRAPFAGVVSELSLELGEVLPPGASVMRLVTLDPVSVSVSVSDRDVVALAPEMPVQVSVDARAAVQPGVIQSISPTASSDTRAFEVQVTVPNADQRLLPGMIARVQVEAALAGEGVLVPQDWLVTRLDEIGLFVEDEGVARWRSVEPGAVVGDRVLLAQGLQLGERVVTTGHRDLEDGDALLISREGSCCDGGRIRYGEGGVL